MSYGFEGGADFINMQQIERTLKMSIKGQRLDNKTRNCQGRIQGGRGDIRPLNLEFFVPNFRIASQ